MTENVFVMSGPTPFPLNAVRNVGRSFGWVVDTAEDLNAVCAAQFSRKTAALLFHRDTFGDCSWPDAVRLLVRALPEVRLIVCHKFTDSINWPELCEAGAFHSLWLPFKEDEVRRSFGFVWEANRRRAESAEKNPHHGNIPVLPRAMGGRLRHQVEISTPGIAPSR